MIRIDSVLTLAKSFTAKSTKDASGKPVTIAQVKFDSLLIDRHALDELLGVPVGWSRALYDEQGAPLRPFGVQVYGRCLRVSGTIRGQKPEQTLALLQADLEDVELRCVPLGALAGGKLTWAARGDEVEDLAELLGRICGAKLEIHDGETDDLFRAQSATAAHASQVAQQGPQGVRPC